MTTISSNTGSSSVTSGSTTASNSTTTTTGTGATTTSSVNTSSSGATYLTGTASGLNTQALIQAAMNQFLQPATNLQSQVTANQTKITAYQQLQTLINGLQSSMSKLSSSTFSVLNSGTTDFDNKTATVTASDGSTASNYVTVTAGQSATASSYTLQVNQLAEAQTVASSAMSKTSSLGYAGSFTLSDGSGTPQTINVTADMSLSNVASAINAVSATSGVSASIIKDSSGAYRLVMSANDTNQSITTSVVSGQDVMGAMGITNSSGGFANVLQAAQPAIVTVDGNQITSNTDDITDAVSGLSIQLNNTTPTGVTLNMKVASDPSAVQTDLTNFITAYNSLRSFVTTNQQVNSDGTVSSTAPLFADSLLTGASQMLNSLIATPSGASGSTIQSLADIGITLDGSNNLQISNQSALTSALSSNLSQVASMFQTTYNPSNSALKLMANSTTSAFNFTLAVTANADGTLTGASVNGDSSMFTVSGNLIQGAAGTPYAGLSFALHTTSSMSVQVAIQPGLANKLSNFVSMYGDSSTGLIQSEINTLTSQDNSWNTQIAQIQSNADSYQTQLINKYANMETQVQAQQLVQAQIKALLDSQNKSG